MSSSSIAVASAPQDQLGHWVVDLLLTKSWSKLFDRITRQSFHELLAIVVNGTVVSAPIVQPSQSGWTSFQRHG
jgi:preprotein translocase subunit SecD